MHVVYLISFIEREKSKIYPCYYIGSKSNCYFNSNGLFDKNDKLYWGSSDDEVFNLLLQSNEPKKIEKLYESEIYNEVLNKEKEIQESNDVVANIKFFNKSIATICNYTDPDYATYKHISGNKIVRLPRNHPLVISKEYVGVTYGGMTYNNGLSETVFYENEIIPEGWFKGRLESSKLKKEQNGFYGKQHSEDTIKQIISKREETYKNNPELLNKILTATSLRSKELFTGITLDDDHKRKISKSNKGYYTVKNIFTGETLRIKYEELEKLDKDIWINIYAYSRKYLQRNEITCPYCNKISDEGNASFFKWHFENCKFSPSGKGDIWEPWNHRSNKSYESQKFYFYLDILYEIFLKYNDINKSNKSVTMKIKKEFIFDWTTQAKNSVEKFRNEFNPYESKSWLTFKKLNEEKFETIQISNLESFT